MPTIVTNPVLAANPDWVPIQGANGQTYYYTGSGYWRPDIGAVQSQIEYAGLEDVRLGRALGSTKADIEQSQTEKNNMQYDAGISTPQEKAANSGGGMTFNSNDVINETQRQVNATAAANAGELDLANIKGSATNMPDVVPSFSTSTGLFQAKPLSTNGLTYNALSLSDASIPNSYQVKSPAMNNYGLTYNALSMADSVAPVSNTFQGGWSIGAATAGLTDMLFGTGAHAMPSVELYAKNNGAVGLAQAIHDSSMPEGASGWINMESVGNDNYVVSVNPSIPAADRGKVAKLMLQNAEEYSQVFPNAQIVKQSDGSLLIKQTNLPKETASVPVAAKLANGGLTYNALSMDDAIEPNVQAPATATKSSLNPELPKGLTYNALTMEDAMEPNVQAPATATKSSLNPELPKGLTYNALDTKEELTVQYNFKNAEGQDVYYDLPAMDYTQLTLGGKTVVVPKENAAYVQSSYDKYGIVTTLDLPKIFAAQNQKVDALENLKQSYDLTVPAEKYAFLNEAANQGLIEDARASAINAAVASRFNPSSGSSTGTFNKMETFSPTISLGMIDENIAGEYAPVKPTDYKASTIPTPKTTPLESPLYPNPDEILTTPTESDIGHINFAGINVPYSTNGVPLAKRIDTENWAKLNNMGAEDTAYFNKLVRDENLTNSTAPNIQFNVGVPQFNLPAFNIAKGTVLAPRTYTVGNGTQSTPQGILDIFTVPQDIAFGGTNVRSSINGQTNFTIDLGFGVQPSTTEGLREGGASVVRPLLWAAPSTLLQGTLAVQQGGALLGSELLDVFGISTPEQKAAIPILQKESQSSVAETFSQPVQYAALSFAFWVAGATGSKVAPILAKIPFVKSFAASEAAGIAAKTGENIAVKDYLSVAGKQLGQLAFTSALVGGGAVSAGVREDAETGETRFYPVQVLGGGLSTVGLLIGAEQGIKLGKQALDKSEMNPFQNVSFEPKGTAQAQARFGATIDEGAAKSRVNELSEQVKVLTEEARGLRNQASSLKAKASELPGLQTTLKNLNQRITATENLANTLENSGLGLTQTVQDAQTNAAATRQLKANVLEVRDKITGDIRTDATAYGKRDFGLDDEGTLNSRAAKLENEAAAKLADAAKKQVEIDQLSYAPSKESPPKNYKMEGGKQPTKPFEIRDIRSSTFSAADSNAVRPDKLNIQYYKGLYVFGNEVGRVPSSLPIQFDVGVSTFELPPAKTSSGFISGASLSDVGESGAASMTQKQLNEVGQLNKVGLKTPRNFQLNTIQNQEAPSSIQAPQSKPPSQKSPQAYAVNTQTLQRISIPQLQILPQQEQQQFRIVTKQPTKVVTAQPQEWLSQQSINTATREKMNQAMETQTKYGQAQETMERLNQEVEQRAETRQQTRTQTREQLRQQVRVQTKQNVKLQLDQKQNQFYRQNQTFNLLQKKAKVPPQQQTRVKSSKPSFVGVLPDYISAIKSQFKYGKATAVSLKENPNIGRFAFAGVGYVPTAEQFKGKKGGFKFPKF